MYWALALGEESHSVRSLKMPRVIMTIYPAEFHRRCQQRWERRAASRLYESAQRMPWLLAIGRTLRVELNAVEQPVSASYRDFASRPAAPLAERYIDVRKDSRHDSARAHQQHAIVRRRVLIILGLRHAGGELIRHRPQLDPGR
jgi:hypothetical protein